MELWQQMVRDSVHSVDQLSGKIWYRTSDS